LINYNFLLIIVTILVTNNFLLCKLVSKLVILVTNNFWSLKLVTNEAFSYSDNKKKYNYQQPKSVKRDDQKFIGKMFDDKFYLYSTIIHMSVITDDHNSSVIITI